MTKPRYTLAALALCAVAGSASAAGSWTRTVLQPSQPPVLVSAADGNLARFAHTQVSATRSANAQWLANGMLELREGADVVYSMYTGDRAVFEFAAEARLDELRFHTSWDNGRNDFGFASVDVRNAAGEWTVLENSALALESTGSSGNTYVFADVSGDPLATRVMAVRIVLGNVENGWGGVAEIELLGGFLGTRTVTFCDADGTPLADVPPQTVPTGGAAADPDPAFVPQCSGGLRFAGWDENIYEVFEDIRPRPLFSRVGVQYSRNAVWTKQALTSAAADLAAERNLARLPTTVLSTQGIIGNPNSVTNGVFDYNSNNASAHDTVAFDFGDEADVDEVRVFVCWMDNGRSDVGICAVRARDAAGEWTALEGSLLPYEVTGNGVAGHRLSFADPAGVPFARRVTALEIEFGTTENGYVGLPEIEVFGEFYVPPLGTVIIVR